MLSEQTFGTNGTQTLSLYAARLHPCMATLPVDECLVEAAIGCWYHYLTSHFHSSTTIREPYNKMSSTTEILC